MTEEQEIPAVPPVEGAEKDRDIDREVEELQAQAAEYRDGWQRARAEFANYRKRVEREQADLRQTAAARVIGRYLEVMDDFERALKDPPAEGDAAQWASGVQLIYRKFQAILEAEGVTRIEVAGQAFDPNLHEAVTHEDNPDHASGQVIDVVRHGYRQGDKVIRPAMVRVAR